MHYFNVDNLPAHKSYMKDTKLSDLIFASLPDFSLYQIIPVGQDEVVLISTTLRPQMQMGGVMTTRELMDEFKAGYLALSFDSNKLDLDDVSFMAKKTYLDIIRDKA